jgi:hypothetical protein
MQLYLSPLIAATRCYGKSFSLIDSYQSSGTLSLFFVSILAFVILHTNHLTWCKQSLSASECDEASFPKAHLNTFYFFICVTVTICHVQINTLSMRHLIYSVIGNINIGKFHYDMRTVIAHSQTHTQYNDNFLL